MNIGSRICVLILLAAGLGASCEAKQLAVIVDKTNSMSGLSAADLAKVFKFDSHKWPDGRPIILILRDPSTPEMKTAIEKLYHMQAEQFKALLAAHSSGVIIVAYAIPGFLFMCVAMTTGVMRPDRSPALQQWLYDLGFLSFSGTMGVFLVGSLIWMTAILLDRNRVFPRWFAYLNLCNALTEVVIAPSWIFHRGVFAWNGVIAWWIDVAVFGMYTVVFIYLLRNMILREDFGTGPLPDLPAKRPQHPAAPAKIVATS